MQSSGLSFEHVSNDSHHHCQRLEKQLKHKGLKYERFLFGQDKAVCLCLLYSNNNNEDNQEL